MSPDAGRSESSLWQKALPDSLVWASRAGAIVARWLGIPSYVISEYEHADLKLFRWAGSTILHPGVIDEATYRAAGFSEHRLIAFEGLKEDVTCAASSSTASIRPR